MDHAGMAQDRRDLERYRSRDGEDRPQRYIPKYTPKLPMWEENQLLRQQLAEAQATIARQQTSISAYIRADKLLRAERRHLG